MNGGENPGTFKNVERWDRYRDIDIAGDLQPPDDRKYSGILLGSFCGDRGKGDHL